MYGNESISCAPSSTNPLVKALTVLGQVQRLVQRRQGGYQLVLQASQKCTELRSGISWVREFLSWKAALQLHAVPVEGYTPLFSVTPRRPRVLTCLVLDKLNSNRARSGWKLNFCWYKHYAAVWVCSRKIHPRSQQFQSPGVSIQVPGRSHQGHVWCAGHQPASHSLTTYHLV